jgi:uncharacterized peroxidase-related enzyme
MKLWVKYIEEADAEGPVAELYEQARRTSPAGVVPDNIKVLSLRPEVAAAKEQLRRALIGKASSLGARRADMISVVVSGYNNCHFCGAAHAGALIRRGEESRDAAVALYQDWRSLDLPPEEVAMLEYAEKLTFHPSGTTEADIQKLRDAGFSDENICDIVALTAYRHFVNRLHDGLGLGLDWLRERHGDDLVNAIEQAREG